MGELVSIPKQHVFKPPEVCSIAGIQPYILRSWEAEFPMLATPETDGGERLYHRQDVEMVLQIKALVFTEGLTLGAARRKLEAPSDDHTDGEKSPRLAGLVGDQVRERLVNLREELQEIMGMLSAPAGNKPLRASKVSKVSEAKGKEAKGRNAKSRGRRKSA